MHIYWLLYNSPPPNPPGHPNPSTHRRTQSISAGKMHFTAAIVGKEVHSVAVFQGIQAHPLAVEVCNKIEGEVKTSLPYMNVADQEYINLEDVKERGDSCSQ
jgi:arginine utilization protein RocB